MGTQRLLLENDRASTVALHSAAVERVIREMRSRLSQPFSLHAMAGIAWMSPYHFDRVFRRTTGIPPCLFLSALRLEAAKRLLLTAPLNVLEVCLEVGYESLGTFTRRFTEFVGLPPLRFRHWASNAASSYLELFRNHKKGSARVTPLQTGLEGSVHSPEGFNGPIFLGLFRTPIPKSTPVACDLLFASTSYRIPAVPEGSYYLFAAAIPWSAVRSGHLVNPSGLLVGGGGPPVSVTRGVAETRTDITLRPPRLTDPPILIDLTFLLAHPTRNGRRFGSAVPATGGAMPRA